MTERGTADPSAVGADNYTRRTRQGAAPERKEKTMKTTTMAEVKKAVEATAKAFTKQIRCDQDRNPDRWWDLDRISCARLESLRAALIGWSIAEIRLLEADYHGPDFLQHRDAISMAVSGLVLSAD